MATVIKKAGQRLDDVFELIFYYDDKSGESTFFICSAEGVPVIRHQQDQVRYDACLMGAWHGRRVKKPVIEEFSKLVKYPAELLCECGKTFPLSQIANECDCDLRYDSKGSNH